MANLDRREFLTTTSALGAGPTAPAAAGRWGQLSCVVRQNRTRMPARPRPGCRESAMTSGDQAARYCACLSQLFVSGCLISHQLSTETASAEPFAGEVAVSPSWRGL